MTVEIGDYVDVVSGPAYQSASFTGDSSDIPLIKGENIAQGYIAWEKSRYWPIGQVEGYERFRLAAGDIVLAMDRPWITAGLKWARLKPHDPPSLLVQRVARLRARSGLRQDFLAYIIGSATFSKYVRNIMGGTNVPHISGSQIRKFKFPLPRQKEQAAIASTLSAYDDLIENNRRRIALLEEAARLLFREWFVYFRFPGYEYVRISNDLPEGWKRQNIGQLVELKYGKTLKQGDRIKGVFQVYGSSGIVGYHHAALVEGPAIVVGRKGNVGSIYWSPASFWPIDTVYFIPKEYVDFWIYLMLPSVGFQNTDTGVPGLNRDFAYSRKLIVPPPNLRRQFNETVEPIFSKRTILENYNQRLAQARDLLLPRLMNGDIAV